MDFFWLVVFKLLAVIAQIASLPKWVVHLFPELWACSWGADSVYEVLWIFVITDVEVFRRSRRKWGDVTFFCCRFCHNSSSASLLRDF